MQPPPRPNLEVIREVVHELYGSGLKQFGHPEFYKPYPEAIDIDNPSPRVYRILEFSLFFGEDG